MLADYRDQLISEVTRWINRFRWHLVVLMGNDFGIKQRLVGG
jgi:hypothetical protein